MSTPPDLLIRHLQPQLATASTSRPHITLTWAQSLDSKIAGEGGRRVILSGPESMLMTHWMRAMHEAILIGVNTLILDDPRLQINLLPDDPSLHAPQPIILDPKLRFPLTSRILSEWQNHRQAGQSSKRVRQPWIICGDDVDKGQMSGLTEAGVRVIPTKLRNGRIPPEALPSILSQLDIRSAMIEGGSSILSSFLHAPPRPNGDPVVDSIIITVAPMFIGKGIGVVPENEGHHLPSLETVHTEAMGKDAIMVCKMALKE